VGVEDDDVAAADSRFVLRCGEEALADSGTSPFGAHPEEFDLAVAAPGKPGMPASIRPVVSDEGGEAAAVAVPVVS
jgi:hypothetical protein